MAMEIRSLNVGGAGHRLREFEIAAESCQGSKARSAGVGCNFEIATARCRRALESSDNGGRTASFERWRRRGAGHVRGKAGNGSVEGSGGTMNETVDGMKKLLSSEEKEIANEAALDLVSSLDERGREALVLALYQNSLDGNTEDYFKQADKNLDGIIDEKEFAIYAEAQAVKYGTSSKPLTTQQLFHLFSKAAVGMVGFGFTDNAIMIVAGDAIQNSIGASLGLTTLLSAGLGNAVADLIGTAFRGYIERLTGKLMVQDVPISAIQLEQKEAWWADTVGASFGVTVGCLLGLTPLFLLQRKEGEKDKDAITVNTKLASISSSIAASSSFSSSGVAAASASNDVECFEHSTQIATLSTSIQPAVTPPLQLRSFHSKLLGTPLLLLSLIVFMALRRVLNYRKPGRVQNRKQIL